MFTKFALILAVVALVASAGTVPPVGHYTITVSQPAVVQGTTLKPGEYRLIVAGSKVTLTTETGKNVADATVKVETEDKKFDTTVVLIDNASGKPVISEIRLGGTKSKLIFAN